MDQLTGVILLCLFGVLFWVYKKGKDSMYASLMSTLQRGEQTDPESKRTWGEFRRLLIEVYGKSTYQPVSTIPTTEPNTAVISANTQNIQTTPAEPPQGGGLPTSVGVPVSTISRTHLDSANILLFIGAFLIIAAATTFASFASDWISGGVKLALMILFGGGFYVSGIMMNKKVSFLKPASIVFTAIGMVMVPYIGYVYFRDIDSMHLARVWLMTSLVATLLYGFALRTIRHPLLGYVFSASIASASISFTRLVGDTTPYFLPYGLMLASIVSLIVHKVAEEALIVEVNQWRICTFSYHVLALAIGCITYFTGGDLYFLVILTTASMFYAIAQMGIDPKEHRNFFATWASAALIINAGLWFHQVGLPRQFIALIILIISTIYIAVGGRILALTQRFNFLKDIWMTVGQVSSLAPLVIGYEISWYYFLMVGTIALLHLGVVAKYKSLASHLTAAVILAYLVYLSPQVAHLDHSWIPICAVGYTLLGYGYMAASRKQMWQEETSQICSVVFLILGGIFTLSVVNWYLQIMLFVYLAGAALVYARRAQNALISVVSSVCLYASGNIFLNHFGYDVGYMSLMYVLLGGLVMVLTSKSAQFRRQVSLCGAYTGLVASYIASLFYVHSSAFYAGPLCTLVGSIFVLYTTDYASALSRSRAALGIALAAALWSINIYGFENIQWYIVPISAYLLLLAHDAQKLNDHSNKDLWTFLALATLTLPTGVQALSSTVEYYRLLILGYGIAILIAGIYLRYKLVQWWGIGTIVLVVLYVIGPYLYQIPSWGYYLLLGGIFLIAAVKILSRHRQDS